MKWLRKRLAASRTTLVRCGAAIRRGAASLDFEDWSYYVGVSLIAAGAWRLNPSAGLCGAGALIAFPAFVSIMRSRSSETPKEQ